MDTVEIPNVGADADASAGSELERVKAELEQTREQMKRIAAESENFRRRQESSFAQRLDSAKDDLVGRFLPFIDNLERAVKAAREGGDVNALCSGVELVLKDVLKTLDVLDVKPIKAVGEIFDPAWHQAVMMEERADVPDETIVEEFKCGYACGGRVIRPSMVKVARNS